MLVITNQKPWFQFLKIIIIHLRIGLVFNSEFITNINKNKGIIIKLGIIIKILNL